MKRFAVLLVLVTAVFAYGAEGEPRRYIVEFSAAPVSTAQLQASRTAERFRADAPRSATVRREFRRALNAVAIELPEGESVAAIARLPYVSRVSPDAEVRAFESGMPIAGRGFSALTGANGTGAGIVVAVIDTGIDYQHPALGGGIGPGRKVAGGWDFVNNDADPMDDGRHGTHVAGIIAGQSAEFTGVAPGVTLIAYKVLNATGRGRMSDAIAALERAIDPNADGDPSDHVDIANLSLGSFGHPDDPVSRAVDNAVAAGIVVCAAAGNEGAFHSIGSPGVAASAITVGAVDATSHLADFSSRGPATVSGAVKPDVLAPGVSILSTFPNGGYGTLSGTSMATPYVSGVAALVVAAHPDWEPARVKSAIVATSQAIAAEEVMAQGAGALSVDRALASDMHVAPTQFNFGIDGSALASWESVRSVTLRNESGAPREISLRADELPAGVTLTLPETFTLAAGNSREINIRVTVDNAALGKPQSESLAFGGIVNIEWNGGAIRLPWAFIRAARAVVTYQNAFPAVIWDIPSGRYQSSRWIGEEGSEILVEPGTYDLAVIAQESDGTPFIIVKEATALQGDVVVALGPQDAPHEITLGTFSGSGSSATKLMSLFGRLIAPGGSVALPIGGHSLRTSSLSDRYTLLLTEALVDTASREIRVAQHEPLHGVSASHLLQVAPSEYAAQEIVLRAASTSARTLAIMPREWPRDPNQFAPRPPEISTAFPAGEWHGMLFMTPEVHPDFASGVQLAVRTDAGESGEPLLYTPVIRRDGEGFFALRQFARNGSPVGVVAGESMTFGDGPLHIPGSISISAGAVSGNMDLHGDRGETVAIPVQYRIIDKEAGNRLASGTLARGQTYIPLPKRASIEATLDTDDYVIAGRHGTATLTLSCDTRRGDFTLPAITSLAVLDGTGRHATRLPYEGNGSMHFSVRGAQTVGVFVRVRGRNTWFQVTPVETGSDDVLGRIYRVDLTETLRFEGEIEVRFEAIGENDGATVWQLAPAFISERERPSKRRAVR